VEAEAEVEVKKERLFSKKEVRIVKF